MPAVANAVVNALAEFGIQHIENARDTGAGVAGRSNWKAG
jgi:hypothetical protein